MRSYFFTRLHRRFVIKYFGSESLLLLIKLLSEEHDYVLYTHILKFSKHINVFKCTAQVLCIIHFTYLLASIYVHISVVMFASLLL